MKNIFVGAVIHYRYRPQDEPCAAIVTKVHDQTWVSLLIISQGGGTRFASHVERGVGWQIIDEPAETPNAWNGI